MPKSKLFLGMVPNHLTFFRALVGVIIPFLIISDPSWMHLAAAVLFVFGALSDYFDGWLARRYAMASDSGKWLDPLADKILVLGCLWAFARADQILSYWFFIAVLVREVIVTFCRTGWILGGNVFGAETAGKWKLFFQTLLIGVAFFVLIAGDGHFPASMMEKLERMGDWTVSICSMIVLFLTWYSGLNFLFNHRALFHTPFFAKYFLAAGVGLMPIAPGTWGSAIGVFLAAAFQGSIYGYFFACVAMTCFAYFFFERFKDQFPKDPPFFVIDEVLGIFVTFALTGVTLKNFLPGFLLFRLFDIWKPFPIRRLERLPGFWGIMTDDLLAGVYAAVILWMLPL